MATVPTVKVKRLTGFTIINEADFDPDKHMLYEDPPAKNFQDPVLPETIKLDSGGNKALETKSASATAAEELSRASAEKTDREVMDNLQAEDPDSRAGVDQSAEEAFAHLTFKDKDEAFDFALDRFGISLDRRKALEKMTSEIRRLAADETLR